MSIHTIHTHGSLNVYNKVITNKMCGGCQHDEYWNTFRHLTATINNKRVAYNTFTIFEIQVGKGKSSYKTKYSIKGNLKQALMYYQGLNTHSGHKKRLFVNSFNKPVLVRYIS